MLITDTHTDTHTDTRTHTHIDSHTDTHTDTHAHRPLKYDFRNMGSKRVNPSKVSDKYQTRTSVRLN